MDLGPPQRTVILCVLDGFGLSDDPRANPLLAAEMPIWRRLNQEWPHCRLVASGEAVGLPAGQMGNSEVGHLNLGAGYPVLQDLPRINEAIADGSFFENAALVAACEHARRGGRLHLLGLVGPGGIHAVDGHLEAMVELARRHGLPSDRVALHLFTDGRDTPPRSAEKLVVLLLERLHEAATPTTVSGRYWAMDRDRRWDRTARAWEAIVHGRGESAATAAAAVSEAHGRGVGDEFIPPCVVGDSRPMANGASVVHLNFRADRARQLTQALALDEFDGFDRGIRPGDLRVTTLTDYQDPELLPVQVAFPPLPVSSLAAEIARLGIRQLHLAETEKYAHVTYFFNGGAEDPLPGEERILVPSRRDVPTYDLAPEMSAGPITDALVAAIRSGRFGFIIVNYANLDMVGHTGSWDAGRRAAETVDACLGRVVEATQEAGAALVVTADHGNIESMRDSDGGPHTAHTTAPVPLVLVADGSRGVHLRDGTLADVAPTLCQLLGIRPPAIMTGRSLVHG